MNRLDLEDNVAIVTGGAQGIGLAVAERILASGGSVALWDRDEVQLAETARRLGDRAFGMAADIGDAAAVRAAVEATMERFGRIDVLINNAAIVGPNAPLWEYPEDDFAAVMHIDVTGTFHVCRAVVPIMRQANYGRIVNVASIAGKEGNPNACAYSSAKAAVIALTKSLGKELADMDIAVNCVTPAVARTKSAMEQTEEHIAYMLAKIPRGRMMELEEAAAMICWLSTRENSFTTGAVFDLSGGRATY